MLGPISVAFTILSFHCTRDLAHGLGGGHGEPRDANSPEDIAKWEAKCTSDEETWARRERESEKLVCYQMGGKKARRGDSTKIWVL
jgi:hypothetical protein